MSKYLKYIPYIAAIIYLFWLLYTSGILFAIGRVWNMAEKIFIDHILFPAIILISLLALWMIISSKRERKKDIKNKVVYMAMRNIKAYTKKERVLNDTRFFAKSDEYFDNVDGVVNIPEYAKCIILEYLKENSCYVKVKFDDYPEPLYTARWLLRTPKEIEFLENQLEKKSKT